MKIFVSTEYSVIRVMPERPIVQGHEAVLFPSTHCSSLILSNISFCLECINPIKHLVQAKNLTRKEAYRGLSQQPYGLSIKSKYFS